jgi:hypothetical protein
MSALPLGEACLLLASAYDRPSPDCAEIRICEAIALASASEGAPLSYGAREAVIDRCLAMGRHALRRGLL